MNIRHFAPFVAALAFAFSGCATDPVKLADSRPVDPGRHYPDFAMFARPMPHGAKVIIVRDEGMLGSGVKAKISVDGHALTGLWSTERVEFYVSAGDHIFSIEPVPQLGAGLIEHSFNFRPDQTAYFRVSVNNQGLELQPSTQIQ